MSSSTIILITGANSGVGYAAAQVIATASAHYHVIIGARSAAKGQSAVSQLQSSGADIKGTLSSIVIDINDQSSVDAAAAEVSKQHGRLDVLLNNAGIASQEGDYCKQLLDNFTTNVVGTARVTEAFKPLLAKSSNPYLIYVSSGMGSMGMAEKLERSDWPAYSVSKAAMTMLALKDYNTVKAEGGKIKVFPSCPGFVVSNLRGTSEDQRNPGGSAGDPMDSGRLYLSIIEGKRDADVGKTVRKDGVHPW